MRNLYTIENPVYIPEIGLYGPVLTPFEIDDESVLSLVRRGFTVFKHNPYNEFEKTQVTVENHGNIEFNTTMYNSARDNYVADNNTVNTYNKNDKNGKNKNDKNNTPSVIGNDDFKK